MKRLLIVIAAFWAGAAGADFKCVDEKGRPHFGDTPPPGCARVMMYEVNKQGRVLREIPPTLTEEQLKAKRAEDERRKVDDKQAAEQRRKDTALLSTYASEREIDVARDRNIDPIRNRIKLANERVAAVDKRVKAIEEEMEFYVAGKSKTKKGKEETGKTKEVPSNLTSELGSLRKEKEAIAKTIAASEKEIEALRAKFEGDKKRWLVLKETGLPPPPAKPVEVKAADPKSGKK